MTGAGFAIALVASIANAYAIVFQAAEDRTSPTSQAGRFSLLRLLMRRRRWLMGTGLMVLAWPLQILALGLAPITVVQPTLATTQLVLLVIARAKLRERVGPPEALGALALVGGITAVIVAAPRHTVSDPAAARIALPLALVGAGALLAYALGRLRPQHALWLVIGAGLAYAWVDFVNKLLANDISSGHWGLAIIWLVATVGFGALAFLEETTSLQRRPAVTVAPVIGAVQDPLPVLMALWSGVEVWTSGSNHILPLAGGLALVTLGAALLGRSRAVARVSGEAPPVADGRAQDPIGAPDGAPAR